MKAWVKGIIAGAVIAAVGVIVLVTGLYLNGWKYPFAKEEFTMQTETVTNADIAVIDLDIDAGKIKTEFYEGNDIIIDYPVSENYTTDVTVTDNILSVKGPNKRHWWKFFLWNISDIPAITVKLPATEIYDVKVDLDAGTAYLAAGEYGNVDLSIDAGSITVDDTVCRTLTMDADAGQIYTNAVKCQTFIADLDAGSVHIKDIECKKATCKVDAGLITFEKISADETELKISAGKIEACFDGAKTDYTISVDQSAGTCNVTPSAGSTDKTIGIRISAGKAEISFVNA